jgi:hypothetical protein
MATIFISYRRDDTADVCGRIYDRLEGHFGTPNVFKDVDSIPAGADFREALERMVERCDVLLAVIGPKWAGPLYADGRRRIDLPGDFVRTEIELAMKRAIPILPVLVYDARMPAPETLPPSVAPLAYRNALTVRSDPDFRRDMERVIRSIETLGVGDVAPVPVAPPPQPEPSQRRPAQATGAAAAGGALPRGGEPAHDFETISKPQTPILQASDGAIGRGRLFEFGGITLIIVSWFLPWITDGRFSDDNALQLTLGAIREFRDFWDFQSSVESTWFLGVLILLTALGAVACSGVNWIRAARHQGRIPGIVCANLVLAGFAVFASLCLTIAHLFSVLGVGVFVMLLGLLSLLVANIAAYRAILRSSSFKTQSHWEAWTAWLRYPRIGVAASLSLAVYIVYLSGRASAVPVPAIVAIALAIVAIPWAAGIIIAQRRNAKLWMLVLVCSGVAALTTLGSLVDRFGPFGHFGYFDYSTFFGLAVYLPSLSTFLFGLVGPRPPTGLGGPV